MASFRKVGSKYLIRFYDRNRTPKEIPLSLSARLFTEKQARRKARELETLYELGQWDPWTKRLPSEERGGTPRTLLEAVEAYCEHKRQLGRRGQRGGWNAETHRDYLYVLRDFARRSGPERSVQALSSRDLERFLFDDGVAAATRSGRRRRLKTFLNWLAREGAVAHVPEMPRPFVERRTIPEYYTLDEMEAVCRAHARLSRETADRKHVPKTGRHSPLAQLWMNDCWRFAFYQGLRLRELLAMRAGAVDLQRNMMAVGDADFIPKGRDERVITITPPARAVLNLYMVDPTSGESKSPQTRVWPRVQPDRLSKRWKRSLRRAAEDGDVAEHKTALSFHDLRDSCCNYWLNEKGVPLERVQELLRHKSIKTTERFYRSTNVEAQTRAFEAGFSGNETPAFGHHSKHNAG